MFTLWAPRWRDAGDEWEAFLGKGDDLYAFDSVPDLIAFVRADRDNDLVEHPAWQKLSTGSVRALDPRSENLFDLVKVYELLAEKPSAASVDELANTLALVAAIGSVCELSAVTKFFNGNPVLSTLSGGIENFSDKPGMRRWNDIGAVVDKGWEKVVEAIEEVVSTPKVDSAASKRAEAELTAARETEPEEVEEEVDEDEDSQGDELDGEEAEAIAPSASDLVLGIDEDFWLKVGIDPVQMITSRGTFYTLRCYLDDSPIFLGRNGRISVFSSERSLARYLADEHDHDLSDLATYDDIRTAATDGSLQVEVTEENVYVMTGIADDIHDGPSAIDRHQLELAVELLRDVGEYAEDDTVNKTLKPTTALGKLVAHVLDPDGTDAPAPPYARAVAEWTELETLLESRLRPE